MQHHRTIIKYLPFVAVLFFMTQCDTYKKQSKSLKGGVIGGAAGGTIGALIGHSMGNTAIGAILGGAIGGTAGALVGHRMDKQAAELRNSVPNAKVERVGEGIQVKFNSGILFDVSKAAIKPTAQTDLNGLATSLQKNSDTKLQIDGYTDNTGSDDYNLSLSEKRANAVKIYLMNQGVDAARLTTVGYGPTHPIADNTTEAGRAENRRVEIGIMANEKMKSEAVQSAQNGGGTK